MVSATSKVLASNCLVATLTLSVSWGCFCSIRLCGARGFSKLKSLMYWPWMVSGLGACCGCVPGVPGGGGVDMGRAGTMQGRPAQAAAGRGRAAIAKQVLQRDDKADEIRSFTPPDRRLGLPERQWPRRLESRGGRQVRPGGDPRGRRPAGDRPCLRPRV